MKFVLPFFALLILMCGCGDRDTNKLDIDKNIFTEGKQIVKLYAKAYNEDGEGESGSKAHELANAFLGDYETGNYSSEDEEYFITLIKLLQTQYTVYGIADFNESLSGEDEGVESAKEKVKDSLLEIKETFGISLE
ncbi:hypothetical protein J9317_16645 [Metabacillus sp. KIGAM252]|uniref:Uncharacterized protein n=1 Tax=Metabacillus flavus TaxID=2823519 RepID=A0ABS5LI09_9BACI|nr:hypothetical protein [Metabacillus flavus]MBS2970377.1 hypothetical protein [Metabacillus flavus]